MKCKHDTLIIPSGNDFCIHLCRKDVAPANPDEIDFSLIDGLEAYATKESGIRIPLEYQIDKDGDILIIVNADAHKLSTYGIELKGKFRGHNWRWKCCAVFRLTDCSCESTVNGMESFDVETYYIWDILDFIVEDNTLDIVSEGHAWIDGDVLHIMDTDYTEVTFENDKMIVRNLNA